MTLATETVDLFLSKSTVSMVYEIDTYRYIISPEETVENRIQAKVKKTFVRHDHMGYLYSLEVLERKQSNTEDVLGIEDRLAALQNKLVVYTNDHGEVISVVNRGEISENWYEQRASIKKKYKNDFESVDDFIQGVDAIINDSNEFLNLVKKSEIVTLLFPPIFQHNLFEEDIIRQSKVFHDFFDTNSLPFKIATTVNGIHYKTKGLQIERSGSIDTARFKKDDVQALFSSLFNIHKYSLNIEPNYLEVFDLDSKHQVAAATALLSIEIKGVYSYRQISKLKAMGDV